MHRYDDLKSTQKEQRKTNYSDEKQHKRHKDNKNNNNYKTKNRKKWIFQAIKTLNLIREDLDKAKEMKS